VIEVGSRPVERCLASPFAKATEDKCEADAVDALEGSRFYPEPVCTHILETPRLPGGRVGGGGSRERLLTPPTTTAIDFVSYRCNAVKPNRIPGRYREPPARQSASEIRRLFARSSQVTGNVQKRLPWVATRSASHLSSVALAKGEARRRSTDPTESVATPTRQSAEWLDGRFERRLRLRDSASP
jgi:hypothetical protein